MELFGFLALGIVAGILSGLFGIGGGIVMVPSLIVFFGLDILDANATSLAAMLLPVGMLGVLAYYKAGLIDLRDSLWIALGLFVGSFGGGELAVNLDEKVLGGLYAGILLYIAFNYLDVRSWFRKGTKTSSTAKPLRRPIWAYLLVGLVAGIFAGLFGKGGGIVIVPMLVAYFRYEPKKAAATSLAALQLPVGLPSVVIYAQDGHLHLLNALLIAVGIVFGALLGSKLGVKLPSSVFKKVFGVFLIFVAVYMVLK
jgi:uncharacterized membrane protein YfcA